MVITCCLVSNLLYELCVYILNNVHFSFHVDVFDRFKRNDGKFKESLLEDVKGMLSFYEAVHFRTTKDHILDEALSFTLDYLEPLARDSRASPPHMLKHIQNALYIPQHQKGQVLVAREYLSFYEQEKDHDDTMLKLAKINFKFLQLHYIQELKIIIKCVNEYVFFWES